MENSSSMYYPIRPQAKNCLFFAITGTCRYGEYCRFNHTVDNTTVDQDGGNQNGYLNSTWNIPCKFFSAGICRYGLHCRFYHPSPVAPAVPDFVQVQYNSHGFPMRMGVSVCSFYMKAGWCGYGATCKFHHPELMEFGTKELYGAYAGAEAAYPYAGGYNWNFQP